MLHGTFAAQERWWRLGNRESVTFADKLEMALQARGLEGLVWLPALNHGMSYRDFSWAGSNTHKDRIKGAKTIAKSLEDLARNMGCSSESPLQVDVIAHSHGGNVALEMFKRLDHLVKVRQVVMLGTPLISNKIAFRPLRFLLATILLLVVLLLFVVAVINVVNPSYAPDFGRLELIGWSIFLIFVYGWAYWLFAEIADLILRWIFVPIRFLTGHRFGQAYGPDPRVLGSLVSRKIVLLTSHQDEADLALQLGSAPRNLYLDEVKARLTGVAKFGELIFFRPFMDGLVLKTLEAILERYVLGFSWAQVMFRDFESVGIDMNAAYPPHLFQRVDVTDKLIEPLKTKIREISRTPLLEPKETGGSVAERGRESLRTSLIGVGQEIGAQIRLRHSVYYESEAVIDIIADSLTTQRGWDSLRQTLC